MVSLYDLMLHPFKHKGHCVALDSAYTGYIMCQVGQEEWWHSYGWHCSIVTYRYCGSCSLAKERKLSRKLRSTRGTHKLLPHQHSTKPLLFDAWADNNFVKTISSFHLPTIVQRGTKRRKLDPVTKKRDREQSDVDSNTQQIEHR